MLYYLHCRENTFMSQPKLHCSILEFQMFQIFSIKINKKKAQINDCTTACAKNKVDVLPNGGYQIYVQEENIAESLVWSA